MISQDHETKFNVYFLSWETGTDVWAGTQNQNLRLLVDFRNKNFWLCKTTNPSLIFAIRGLEMGTEYLAKARNQV